MKLIAAAMLKIQADIRGARKTKKNTHFGNSYADLESVWDALRTKLQENKIAVVQAPQFRDGVMLLNTQLIHESGESLSGDYLIRPVKEDPQAYASAYTYARRYSLCGMFGLTNEDDDGNKGAAKTANIDKVKKAEAISSVERIALSKAWRANGWTDSSAAELLNDHGISSTADIERKDYPTFLTTFSNKPSKK